MKFSRFGFVLKSLLAVAVAGTGFFVHSASAALFYVPLIFDPYIEVLDSASNKVVTKIPSAEGVDQVSVSADGSRVVAINNSRNSALQVITTSTNSSYLIPLEDEPATLAISADGKKAYVAFDADAGEQQHLSLVDLDKRSVVKDLQLSSSSLGWRAGLALTRDEKKLIAAAIQGQIEVYDATTLALLKTIPTDGFPNAVVTSPNRPLVYVQNTGPEYDITILNTETYETTTLATNDKEFKRGIGVTPDGASIYVLGDSSVLVFDATTLKRTATIALKPDMVVGGIAFTPDGKYAYIAQLFSDVVSVVDVSARKVKTSIAFDGPETIATRGLSAQPDIVPFSKFSPELRIDHRHNAYSVAASFTLGTSAPALTPTTQALTLTIGSHSVSVPAGAIQRLNLKSDLYAYEGTINGEKFGLVLTGKGTGPWAIVAVGSHDFGNISEADSTPVTLSIGSNTGVESIKPFCGGTTHRLFNERPYWRGKPEEQQTH